MWRYFEMILGEKWKMKRKWRCDWRQFFQVVLLGRGSEKCSSRWEEWDERTFFTIFFLKIRALMHVSVLIEMVERRKRNQSCNKEGLIKEQNPWEGRADGIQSRRGEHLMGVITFPAVVTGGKQKVYKCKWAGRFNAGKWASSCLIVFITSWK